ncbi:hypothetical protein LINPERHAP2_LOCUS7392, partial [Linum perenne]
PTSTLSYIYLIDSTRYSLEQTKYKFFADFNRRFEFGKTIMGGSCSRKRWQLERNHNNSPVGRVCRKLSKNGSSKWLLLTTVSKQHVNIGPSLLDLCIQNICNNIDKHTTTFYMLPRDITQQIFNHLVNSLRLTDASLQAFSDCALQDIHLAEYPVGVNDYWMEAISSQGMSLLSVDISGSDVTDSGLGCLKVCNNLETLNFDYCVNISDLGLKEIGGLSNLTSLSFRRNNGISVEGLRAVATLTNLVKLDMERCPGIGGGALVHLNGTIII